MRLPAMDPEHGGVGEGRWPTLSRAWYCCTRCTGCSRKCCSGGGGGCEGSVADSTSSEYFCGNRRVGFRAAGQDPGDSHHPEPESRQTDPPLWVGFTSHPPPMMVNH